MSEMRGTSPTFCGAVCYYCGRLYELSDRSHCEAWPDEPDFVCVSAFDVFSIMNKAGE